MRAVLTTAVLLAVAAAALPAQSPSPPEVASIRTAAAALSQMHSLLISRDGRLVVEYYAPGHGATRLANVKSVSKSIVSTLVGIAIEQELIDGLDAPIVRWFPELRQSPDARKPAITIGDLVTMRSGLASTSGEHYGAWVNSRNWVTSALARPMISAPGDVDGVQHRHVAHPVGHPHEGDRQEHAPVRQRGAGTPIGFSFANWLRDPQGVYFGGNEMQMTPRQMIAVGELYLNNGRAAGRQVVPAAWVERSCEPVTRSRFDRSREYGLGWWVQEIGGHRACFAWGYGGQYIMFFRDLDLVVAVTSSPDISDERHGYRRQLFELLRTRVLPIARSWPAA
jgi:CubicO group peptidase (beta-lactamase class C family)